MLKRIPTKALVILLALLLVICTALTGVCVRQRRDNAARGFIALNHVYFFMTNVMMETGDDALWDSEASTLLLLLNNVSVQNKGDNMKLVELARAVSTLPGDAEGRDDIVKAFAGMTIVWNDPTLTATLSGADTDAIIEICQTRRK